MLQHHIHWKFPFPVRKFIFSWTTDLVILVFVWFLVWREVSMWTYFNLQICSWTHISYVCFSVSSRLLGVAIFVKKDFISQKAGIFEDFPHRSVSIMLLLSFFCFQIKKGILSYLSSLILLWLYYIIWFIMSLYR